jgi:hypothetical protein
VPQRHTAVALELQDMRIELPREAANAEEADSRGRELDGQRVAVEPLAQLGDDGRVVVRQRESCRRSSWRARRTTAPPDIREPATR